MKLAPPFPWAASLLLSLSSFPAPTRTAPLDAEIRVSGGGGGAARYRYYGTLAGFGSSPSRRQVTGTLGLPPPPFGTEEEEEGARLLCDDDDDDGAPIALPQDVVALVPRGGCSFERKALAARRRMGAGGIIIYDTLASRYGYGGTTGGVVFPRPRIDYDCDNGWSDVPHSTSFSLDPPAYSGGVHDRYLTFSSPDNLCRVEDPARCESRRCLVTGPAAATAGDGTAAARSRRYRACCAWDVTVRMAGDPALPTNGASAADQGIVAAFASMRLGDALLGLLASSSTEAEPVVVTIRERPHPRFNASSFLLWTLAVSAAAFAAWHSARDYRGARRKMLPVTRRRGTRSLQGDGEGEESTTMPAAADEPEGGLDPSAEQGASPSFEDAASPDDDGDAGEDRRRRHQSRHAVRSSAPQRRQEAAAARDDAARSDTPQHQRDRQRAAAAPTFELNVWYSLGFVVVATTLLFVLYFFQVYTWLTVLYGIGCSGVMASLVFVPICRLVGPKLGLSGCCLSPVLASATTCRTGLNNVTWAEVVGGALAYSVGAVWIVVAFNHENPYSNAYFWIVQDFMGACLSILFLSHFRLNSIKVATVLLVALFVYDIFFVFLTPYIFDGDSVMVTVAKGGEGGSASEDYCERYPEDDECEEPVPLPMVLTIPYINDYRGGQSLLGLGDIVLPGLLISFAARLDECKRLVGAATNTHVKLPTRWYGGYLFPLILAYAIGLMMASIAVVLMKRGQPALLYIVPACLGTVLLVGRKELGELWRGPKVIRIADDQLVQCRPIDLQSSSAPSPPVEERAVVTTAGSTNQEPAAAAEPGPARLAV